MIDITPKNYRSIKAAYDQAVIAKDRQLIWQGSVIDVAYAKSMLEYMHQQLGGKA